MRFRPSLLHLAATVIVGSALLVSACGDDAASPSDTTTGTVSRTSVPSTTTTEPTSTSSSAAGNGKLGLWLSSPTGISDEKGDKYATPAAGETLRAPVDDGVGGVYYLRCAGEATTCGLEHVSERNGTPEKIGVADDLFALGTWNSRQVLLVSWTDPSRVPSFQGNVSGLVGQAIDPATRAVVATFDWFGWESGPFAADVENSKFAACFGEGETCELDTFTESSPHAPVPNVDPSTVTSLALDADGTHLTWIASVPMAGGLTARTLDTTTGAITDVKLRADTDPAADDSVTDGAWAAVRIGPTVQATNLTDVADKVQMTVPDGVTGMAIRPSGGGSDAASSL